jgi:pyruvate dehydrogenase E2 component (dihydrolipoamide acetyltransferase)
MLVPPVTSRYEENLVAEEVKLPQLGESVTEGVITAWLVEVGDDVSQDQPLVEISTDKVDTEIPSPLAGTVQELRAAVDDTIEVGQVIAIIGEGEVSSPSADGDTSAEEATEQATAASAPEETEQAAEARTDGGSGGGAPRAEQRSAPATPPAADTGNGRAPAGDAALTSPLVRKLLREAGLSADDVRGSGPGGRITREDADRAIASGGEGGQPAAAAAGGGDLTPAPTGRSQRPRPQAAPKQVEFQGREHTEDLTRIRRSIARHMHESITTTAQLTAVIEVDMTRLMQTRQRAKDQFKAREGVSLSPLPMISRAVCMTLPRHPSLNSSLDLEAGTATYYNYVNLGMAVDTEMGLIVPNIKDAQDLTVPGLARQINDVADRARRKKLQPDEIAGGTFTITNTGSRGVMIDTPILNPPEVAILATTLIEKRAVVIEDEFGQDTIAIRHISYMCMTYDHRMVDGADAARFLGDLTYVLETHDFAAEVGLQA